MGEKWKWFRDLAIFISVSNKNSKTVIIQFLENSLVSWSWKVSRYQILCKIVLFMGIILKSKLLIRFLARCDKVTDLRTLTENIPLPPYFIDTYLLTWAIQKVGRLTYFKKISQCTEMRLVSFLFGGSTTMAVINPTERKLAKRTSVQWCLARERSFMSVSKLYISGLYAEKKKLKLGFR